MGCGSEFFTSNCVCDTLLAIVDAQEKVNPMTGCVNSCETAIQQLVNGTGGTVFDTIPVILYCKGTCEPFLGTGLTTRVMGNPAVPRFETVCGCVFRVVDVDPETCCATLEILDRTGTGPCNTDGQTCLAQLDNNQVADLDLTGVCITVDLNCFCGVACVTPLRLLS